MKPGQGIGVEMVAGPTASKRWRLEREHGRRRPTTGVTTPEQQRHVRQGKAATRHGHSWRRYVQDVRPTTSPSHSRLDGDTRGRQYVSSSGPKTSTSVTLRRAHTPTTSTSTTTVATFVHHGTAQLLELSSKYTVSRFFALTVSQNYYDGP